MNYVKAVDGVVEKFPYTVFDLRVDNPNTSFPKNMTEEQFAAQNMYPVTYGNPPYHDEATQKLVQQTEPVLTNGSWVVGWDVVEKTADEIAIDTAQKEDDVRFDRNQKLISCDWTQLQDCVLSSELIAAWAKYRQQLRDLPQQQGFPYTVIWPSKP